MHVNEMLDCSRFKRTDENLPDFFAEKFHGR